MKDMMAELNQMLEQRAAGEEPDFDGFMERHGDFFPENPQTLDELLEVMARRMAAAQAMLNSMTPEQRAQLQQLSDQLLEDMDLRWQVEQLGQNLRQAVPGRRLGQQLPVRGHGPARHGAARTSLMSELGDLDQLEQLMRGAPNPGALAEADLDRVRELLGDESAASLERMAEITRMLTEAGLIEQREGRLELTPKGMRRLGQNALAELFAQARPRPARPPRDRAASAPGHERNHQTKPYEWGDPFNLQHRPDDPQRHRAWRDLTGPPDPRRLRDRGDRAPGPVLHRAHAGPVAVDADARQLPAGQEGRDGAALADLDAVPA